jgi:hypothetical protein
MSATPPTKKELIAKKYVTLTAELKKHLGVDLLPPIDEIEVCDLLFLFSMYFDSSEEHKENVKTLMRANHIVVDDEKLNAVYPLIEEFIIFIKNIK